MSLRVFALIVASAAAAVAQEPTTGRETEKRFPPLKLAAGFEAKLFACDPLVEHPSVIAIGPRPGTLFVAQDYMTGLGTEIVKRDQIRLIEDGDGDGYADKTVLFADGFNSIQGLAYDLDGSVFAMHAPLLTMVRDTDGDGVADERRDIVAGLGLPPEKNDTRLHAANGVTVGHDGWLYLALGDHGCDVRRPEGDRLVLEGGGILRCRQDGSELHVFATGLRNVYDVALDADLNVFVRDNENDGGDYKIRVYHTFFGADHGYPYFYYERPEETMLPLADLNLGSSAGGACYLEASFPEKFRGNLFFCDWNHSLVRYECQPRGSSFAPMVEFKVASGGDRDRYPFKPSDVIVDWDGSLVVSDWADGQRPKRGRARIYRITHKDAKPIAVADPRADLGGRTLEELITQLGSLSYYARVLAQKEIERRGVRAIEALASKVDPGRGARRGAPLDENRENSARILTNLHSTWILANGIRLAGDEDVAGANSEVLLRLATRGNDRVRVQAVRALSDLCDSPTAGVEIRPEQFLGVMRSDNDPRVVRELVVALGRLSWSGIPEWFRQHSLAGDRTLNHAAMQAFRRSENWPGVLALLDTPADSPDVRPVALQSLGDQANVTPADGLLKRLRDKPEGARRRETIDLLARIHRKPGPWVYWGYRPAARPANPVDWQLTGAIGRALEELLAYTRDPKVREFTLQRMQREKIPIKSQTLAKCLNIDRDEQTASRILELLRDRPTPEKAPILEKVIRDATHAAAIRVKALEIVSPDAKTLHDLAGVLEDGAVLAVVIAKFERASALALTSLLIDKAASPNAAVRTAAIASLGKHKIGEAEESVKKGLADSDASVRRAAAIAAGKIPIRAAAKPLLNLAADDRDATVRCECLEALRALGNRHAIASAVRDLHSRDIQLAAVRYLAEFGNPEHAGAIAEAAGTHPATEFLNVAIRPLAKWQCEEEIARLQGVSGHILRWRSPEPINAEAAARLRGELLGDGRKPDPPVESGWPTILASGADSIVSMPGHESPGSDVRLAVSDVTVAEESAIQFLTAASNGGIQLWLNGVSAFHQTKVEKALRPNAHRVDAKLRPGRNRLVVQIESPSSREDVKFHLRFRRRSSTARHEQLTEAALAGTGDANRGRQLFFNLEKSQCLFCHQLGDQGRKIGPELTGVGGRFSRIYLIESILDPNANVTPGFKTLLVTRNDGTSLVGVNVSETESTLTLGDVAGQLHEIAKSDITKLDEPPVSLMPPGLETLYTEQEFMDLMAFLFSLD